MPARATATPGIALAGDTRTCAAIVSAGPVTSRRAGVERHLDERVAAHVHQVAAVHVACPHRPSSTIVRRAPVSNERATIAGGRPADSTV